MRPWNTLIWQRRASPELVGTDMNLRGE